MLSVRVFCCCLFFVFFFCVVVCVSFFFFRCSCLTSAYRQCKKRRIGKERGDGEKDERCGVCVCVSMCACMYVCGGGRLLTIKKVENGV